MRKKISILFLAMLFVMAQLAPVYAAYPVYDATAVAKLVEELQKWEQQMAYWKQQLASIDPTNSSALKSQIAQFQALQNQLDGLLNDYNTLATNWDALYKDFSSSSWKGTTTADYLADLENVGEALKAVQREAMIAQGMAAETNDDLTILSSLVDSSQNATGTVQAQQVANQIAALQVRQLVRLQQMMAEYHKAQLMQTREQQQQATRAQKGYETLIPSAEEINPDWTNTVNSTGGKSSE